VAIKEVKSRIFFILLKVSIRIIQHRLDISDLFCCFVAKQIRGRSVSPSVDQDTGLGAANRTISVGRARFKTLGQARYRQAGAGESRTESLSTLELTQEGREVRRRREAVTVVIRRKVGRSTRECVEENREVARGDEEVAACTCRTVVGVTCVAVTVLIGVDLVGALRRAIGQRRAVIKSVGNEIGIRIDDSACVRVERESEGKNAYKHNELDLHNV